MSERAPPSRRSQFGFFSAIGTRWKDMDIYGHVNNVQYYSYFDTAIADLLMRRAGFDPWNDPIIGYCVESGCRFHKSLAVPDQVAVGVSVTKIGRTSLGYRLAVFRNDDEVACADGHFVHVFVDRKTQKPAPVPPSIAASLARVIEEDSQS